MDTADMLPADVSPLSRRSWMTGFAVAIGSLAVGSVGSMASVHDGVSHSAEEIHQEPIFKASPKRIYEALTDAQQFQKVELLSGAMKTADLVAKPAVIGREAGTPFSIFGDYIVGWQLDLLVNQRIVQAWRVSNWEPGVYSIAKFELKEQGSGTKLVFDHSGFPAGDGEHLAAGWNAHYWAPLERFLS
jgi:activator of HSP90 ATPase